MKTGNKCIVLLSVFLVIVALFAANIFVNNKGPIEIDINYSRTHDRLVNFLVNELVKEKHVPENLSNHDLKKNTFIYILGGDQDSLIHRFRKASALYHQGLSKKIFILSRPGITEFNQELGRNLTNDEWSIRELEKLNVRIEDVEPISVKKEIFGTLDEARDLSEIVRKRGCHRLILVTSDYHTRRALNTFSRYASDRPFEIFIYGSNGAAGLGDLLSEYFKLLVYNHFAIPGNYRQ